MFNKTASPCRIVVCIFAFTACSGSAHHAGRAGAASDRKTAPAPVVDSPVPDSSNSRATLLAQKRREPTSTSGPLNPTPMWLPEAYEAEQDPNFLGRGFRPQNDVPVGFVPVTSIAAGVRVHEEPSTHAKTIGAISNSHIALVDGSSCHWYTFHPGTESSPGKVRCGDITEDGLIPVFATHGTKNSRWIRIVTDPKGRHGWVQANADVETISAVFKRYIGYTTPYFDRRMYKNPSYSGGSRRASWKVDDAAFKILDTRVVDSTVWFKLELSLDECMHNRSKLLGVGWVPLVNNNGKLQLWYELSC